MAIFNSYVKLPEGTKHDIVVGYTQHIILFAEYIVVGYTKHMLYWEYTGDLVAGYILHDYCWIYSVYSG